MTSRATARASATIARSVERIALTVVEPTAGTAQRMTATSARGTKIAAANVKNKAKSSVAPPAKRGRQQKVPQSDSSSESSDNRDSDENSNGAEEDEDDRAPIPETKETKNIKSFRNCK